jgi:hypothetical protein
LSLINTKFDYESYHHYLNEYLKLKNINNLKNLELSLYYVQKNPYSIFFSKKTYPKNNKDLFFKFVNNQMFLMKVDNPYLKKKSFQEHRKAIIKLVNSNPRQWSFLYQLFAIGDIDVKYIK